MSDFDKEGRGSEQASQLTRRSIVASGCQPAHCDQGGGGYQSGRGGLPTYLRGFSSTARAQGSGPVKLGFIEDESGNLAVYGLQKLHAAQLAVKEINEGKTLKGAPNIGAGMLGAMAQVATNPPVISKEGTGARRGRRRRRQGSHRPRLRRGRRDPDRFRREGRARPRAVSSSRPTARATMPSGSSSPAA